MKNIDIPVIIEDLKTIKEQSERELEEKKDYINGYKTCMEVVKRTFQAIDASQDDHPDRNYTDFDSVRVSIEDSMNRNLFKCRYCGGTGKDHGTCIKIFHNLCGKCKCVRGECDTKSCETFIEEVNKEDAKNIPF